MNNLDDQIIPSLDKNRKKQDIPEFRDGENYDEIERNNEDDYLNAEEIELNKMQLARNLSPFLSMGVVKGLLSRNWNYREQAINVIKNNITPDKTSPLLNFGDEA